MTPYRPMILPMIPRWLCAVAALCALAGCAARAPSPAVPAASAPERIELAGVRQYVVDNPAIGRLFVIEGRAVNRRRTVVDRVEVAFALLDGAGAEVETQRVVCGNVLPPESLRTLRLVAIEAALHDMTAIETANTGVLPGESVPCMTVFYNPPEGVAEFTATPVDQPGSGQ
ncbi:MAG: DUF3426 domain-containing protein [Desulfovibrionaceae bacterium]